MVNKVDFPLPGSYIETSYLNRLRFDKTSDCLIGVLSDLAWFRYHLLQPFASRFRNSFVFLGTYAWCAFYIIMIIDSQENELPTKFYKWTIIFLVLFLYSNLYCCSSKVASTEFISKKNCVRNECQLVPKLKKKHW